MAKAGWTGWAVLLLGVGSASAQEVRWRQDYAAARREAAETGKPLLLDFGTENCVWCRRQDATTFRSPAVVRMLNDRFIPVKVDGHQEDRLTHALGVEAFPTCILAGPDGKIIGRQRGYADPDKMMAFLSPAADLAKVTPPPSAKPQPAPDPLASAKADYDAGRYLACLEKCQRVKLNGGPAADDAAKLLDRLSADPTAWEQLCRQIDARLDELHPGLEAALQR